jgi:acetolactate synthase small subunit
LPIIEAIGSSLPIESDPELEEKIQAYINRHRGKEVNVSNLFSVLGLTGKSEQKEKAKKILRQLGCMTVRV